MKGRKLTFDDHTGSFIAESRIEALERTCRQRERQAQTMNRGEKVVLDSRTNQVCTRYMYIGALLRGHSFCARNMTFQDGWPLVRGRNQHIITIIIAMWPFHRGWPPSGWPLRRDPLYDMINLNSTSYVSIC